MTVIPVPALVEQLVQQHHGNVGLLAEQLGISAPTISRWRSGKAKPRSELEERLRVLASTGGRLVPKADDATAPDRLSQLENSIVTMLHSLREEFHRSASVSSRQDVLDLVAALVFAHVTSIDGGGEGIGSHLGRGKPNAVEALNNFIADQFERSLAQSWRRSFVPLPPTSERFAQELLRIFDNEGAAFRELHNAGRDDLINEVFSRFMSTSFVDEKEMGQYLTPPEIVRFIVEIGLAAVPEFCQGAKQGFLLDPSCGVGSFLAEAIRQLLGKQRTTGPGAGRSNWISTLVSKRLIGIDKSERMVRLAAVNLSLFGFSARKIYVANALARVGKEARINSTLEGQVELILTNPPFGATYSGEDIASFAIGQDRGKVESETLFLERYVDWLAPGGIVASIVPDSILVNRGQFAELRKWLYRACDILAVFSLPPVTFAAAGTTTKTSILVARKKHEDCQARPTYFAEARQIGFDVVTRSGHRRRVRTAQSDLPMLLDEYLGRKPIERGARRALGSADERWDAAYQVGLPHVTAATAAREFLRVSDVAVLIDDRIDPRRSGDAGFDYVEISDVDVRTGLVGHKRLAANEAPSRARRLIRARDVIVSTVRPDRGSIAMVPPELDGAVCSTGLAVLRCFGIEPLALVWLLKTAFVRHQMVLNNIGIAYPAISESTCLNLVLPVSRNDMDSLTDAAHRFELSRAKFEAALAEMAQIALRLDAAATA